MKSVETAYNYAKNNCGLVVDVSSSGAQITRAYTSEYTSGCRPLRELCTTQMFASCQRFDATAVRSIAVQ